jgi:hypothetical protein
MQGASSLAKLKEMCLTMRGDYLLSDFSCLAYISELRELTVELEQSSSSNALLTSNAMLPASSCCSKLTVLGLERFSWTAEQLTFFLQHCPQLTRMDLREFENLTSLSFLAVPSIRAHLTDLSLLTSEIDGSIPTTMPEFSYLHSLRGIQELSIYRMFDHILSDEQKAEMQPPSALMSLSFELQA